MGHIVYTHTYMSIGIYLYIHICVCLCAFLVIDNFRTDYFLESLRCISPAIVETLLALLPPAGGTYVI